LSQFEVKRLYVRSQLLCASRRTRKT